MQIFEPKSVTKQNSKCDVKINSFDKQILDQIFHRRST